MYTLLEEKLREYFGWGATALTIFLYIFPIFPFINVLKGKISYEDTPIIIVTANFVNCFCWYIYGDIIFSDQIKICYLIGSISNSILIMIYLGYEVKKFPIDAVLNALIMITGSYAIYKGFTTVVEDDSVIGRICVAASCVVFLSPVHLIYKVMRAKNYNLIPIYTAFILAPSSLCWIIYGVFITDFYVILPNVIGIILATIQIVIFFKYKRNFPGIGEKENTATIDIESNEIEKDEKGNANEKRIEKEEKEEKEDDNTVIKLDEDNQNNNKEKPVKIVSKIGN